jgi:hypothetical protein
MGEAKENTLLKILVYSNQTIKGITLYEQIILKAKELGLVGVTVIKGMMGFIGDNNIHKPKLRSISESLPVTIEVVDTEENINKLLPFLDESIRDGLVVLMPVSVLKK